MTTTTKAPVFGLTITATALELNRRAFDAAEGAEDATIATVRPQELATLLALIEEHACVRRHRLKSLGAACRTGNGRFECRFHWMPNASVDRVPSVAIDTKGKQPLPAGEER